MIRDLAIARELRHEFPSLRLSWLAGGAARRVLIDAGEDVHAESREFVTGTSVLEAQAGAFGVNLLNPSYIFELGSALKELIRYLRGVRASVLAYSAITEHERFDLVIGDETFDLMIAFSRNPQLKRNPFALIVDCVGVDPMSRNPLEHLAARVANRGWARLLVGEPELFDLGLFVGELEDIPDRSLGRGLPDRREAARSALSFVGYVVGFDPENLGDPAQERSRLGYGSGPLIVCSIGGTAVGARLLQSCCGAFDIVREAIPELQMVLVCGPRLDSLGVEIPDGVRQIGYQPELHRHFAACDLAVVQGGGTTTAELTALRRPFLYFPLESHFEQQLHVAPRLKRHGAGVRMSSDDLCPERLASAMLSNIDEKVEWPMIPADGARRAAVLLSSMLRSAGPDTVT